MKFKYYLRGAGFGVIVATVILSVAFLFQDNMSDAEIMRRAMELGMVMEEGAQGTLADIAPQGVTKVDMETVADDDALSTPDTGVNPADNQAAGDTGTPDNGDAGNTGTPDNGDAGDAGTPDGQAAGNPGTSDNHQGSDADNPGSEGNQSPAGGTDKDTTDKSDSKNQPASPKTDKAKENKDNNADKPADNQSNENKDSVTIEVVGGDVSRVVSEKLQNAGLIDDSEEFNSYMGANGYANNIQPGTFKIKKGSSFKQIADILTSR